MIGFTKLLIGKATVSDALKQAAKPAPGMLQFSSVNAPLVVWNTTRRCNLLCQHCYISALDKKSFKNELTTLEARNLINSLAKIQIPVLLFSGGEPLMRNDLFQVAGWAKEKGIRIVLSSNGTLISKKKAKALKEIGFDYIGISLDGTQVIHDNFRKLPGAFDKAMKGIINALEAGLKTGIRFTLNNINKDSLPAILDLAVKEKIPRFCMYHLVYAGRGRAMVSDDLTNTQRRKVIDELIKTTLEFKDKDIEILTTDNHADGVYIYKYIKEHEPKRADEVKKLLELHGGCSAGTKMANIGPEGNVHACQFWEHKNLGNIKEKDFADIWLNKYDSFMCQMRAKCNHLKGKCSRCKYNSLCGGCRIRAEVARGDMWQEDPACYLSEQEINT